MPNALIAQGAGKMIATKENEREALAKIREIVADLGEDSYLAIAFDGCIEDAEENIEYDFACSWKQRAERLEEQLRSETEQLKELTCEAQELRKKNKVLKARQLSAEDLNICHSVLITQKKEIEAEMKKVGDTIIKWCHSPEDPEFRKAAAMYHDLVQDHNAYEGVIVRIKTITNQ